MKGQSFAIVGAVISALFNSIFTASGQNWVALDVPADNWACVACSADGSNVVAGTESAPTWRSSDSGATWKPTPWSGWLCAALSADGTTIAAAGPNWGVAVSTNSGSTWTYPPLPAMPPVNGSNPGPYNGTNLACSGDGHTLAVTGATSAGFLFFSTDSGVSWTNVWLDNGSGTFGPLSNCQAVACSADGSQWLVSQWREAKLPSGGGISGKFLRATQTGGNLAKVRDYFSSTPCVALASSADGSTLLGLINSTPGTADWGIYATTNAGVDWTVTPSFQTNWTAAACSADGTRMMAVGTGDTIWQSTNAGVTWTPATVPSGNWSAAASSADGLRMFAAMDGGYVYAWQERPTPRLNLAASPGQILLSWNVPSASFVLEQNADLITSTWTEVVSTPVLNYTNLQYQVSVPTSSGSMFYRLASR